MRLKRLEISGFKSIARKTVLSFPGGITCIAGPNGCGKSNLVDAIRWALGEQSSRALRASSMEDVIFSGTQAVPPSGMAKVSLEFTRDGDYFPKSLEGFDEISISRSLYRTGESVYALNRVKCRLKDITDIFLDTGLDRRGYAIIEQGKIKDIINSDPEEIRYLVEEVAEVGRLRYKKAEASRRLKATQANLLRIQDLLSEVSRQRDDLRAQANKAKRYQKLRDSLNTMTRDLWAYELKEIVLSREHAGHMLSEIRDSLEQKTAGMDSRQALLHDLKKEVYKRERDLEELEAKILQASAELDTLRSNIIITESRRDEINAEMKRLAEGIKGSIKRGVVLGEEAARLERDVSVAAREVSRMEDAFISRHAGIQKLKSEYNGILEEYEGKRSRLFDISGKQKVVEQDVISTRNRMKEASKVLGQKQFELEELKRSQGRLMSYVASLEDRKKGLDQILEKLETMLVELERKRLHQASELDALNSKLKDKDKLYSELGVRISMLNRLITEALGEGADDNVQEGKTTRRVADSIRVRSGYEDAVGKSIGNGLEYVVVDDYDQVRESIRKGKKEAGFVPLRPHLSNGDTAKVAQAPGVIGALSSYMDTKDGLDDVAEALARGMVVVKGIEDAMDLWEKGYRSAAMVALDGKVMEPSGIIRCNLEGQRYASGLRAKSEKEALSKQRALIHTEITDLDEKIGKKKADLDLLVREIEDVKKKKQDTMLELERVAKEIENARLRLESLARDAGKVDADIKGWSEMVKRLESELEQKESKRQGLEIELEGIRAELGLLAAKKDGIYTKVTSEEQVLEEESVRTRDTKISLARKEERLNAINEEISLISGRLEEMKHMIRDLAVHLKATKQRLWVLSGQKEEIEKRIASIESKSDNLKSDRRDIQDRIVVLEDEIGKLAKEIESFKEQENEHLLEYKEKEIAYNMLLQRIESRFGKDRPETPEGFDPESTRQKIARIQRKIETMGQINFVALEAFEEAQSRWERLHLQYQDLTQAMERLQQVINSLERQGNKRFLATFEKVRANFRDIFGLLFNGGKADLTLTQAGEAGPGIEIKASPPFKRIKNMSLLSDGEKVLCAISFVFSLFKVKPSPFCILDEVDASLDEANTLRFNRLIKAYSNDTQFIIITHNKQTMEVADVIYGLTFDSPGISKVVAMDLKEMNE